MIKYPSSLPLYLHDPNTLSYSPQAIRTQMNDGSSLQRRTSSTLIATTAFELKLEPSQAAVFDDWYWNALNGGVAAFETEIYTPLGMQTVKCKFHADKSLKAKPIDEYWWHYAHVIDVIKPSIEIDPILQKYTESEIQELWTLQNEIHNHIHPIPNEYLQVLNNE